MPSLLVGLAFGSSCTGTSAPRRATSASCYESSGAIAAAAKVCTQASDCKQVTVPGCCAPAIEVGLASSSSCTFPDASCANISCPAYSYSPQQAEDGKVTAPGDGIGLACVSGQCVTVVIPAGADAGANTDVGTAPDVGAGTGVDAAAGMTLSCADWYRYPVPNTDNVLINNVWNEQHAGTYPYHQCLTEWDTPAGTQFGWSWDWPSCDTSTSFAAPEVVFGRKPWDGGASTSPGLPKRIDAIQSLLVDFGVEVAADACYNLNTTMWLTTSAAAPTDPDPQDITTEVMVRFDDAGHIGGCCTLDGNATIGGIPFQIWHQDGHGDASGGTSYTWKMVIYESTIPTTDTRFDLSLVLKDLLNRGLVASSDAVQGVELITEVSGGSGQLRLDRFNVTVQ